MDDKKRTTDGSYASLKGFRRAVPIILAAIGIFIAVCFLTGDTGSLGGAITSTLLGLFSYGAYAIPILICLHGLFYAHDVHERCLISRSVFSVLTVIIIAAIEYAVLYWSIEPVFDPAGFYQTGASGGFIGSIIAFGIIKIFGPVGLIIICVAVAAIYVTFFFSKSSGAVGRAALMVLGLIADACAAIERGIKSIFRSVKQARADKREQEAKEKTGELADDDFFAVDNGMEKLEITELGIKEVRSSEDMEKNPTLHGSVYHKSAVKGDEQARSGEQTRASEVHDEPVTASAERAKRRTVDLSYGLDDEILNSVTAKEKKADIIYEADEPQKQRKGFGEESAESVFTRDFDPFDFAIGEKEAARLSSGAVEKDERRGISEMTTPISELTEEDALAARRKAAFEMKKRMLVAGAMASVRDEVKTEIKAEPTVEVKTEIKAEAESQITDSPFRPREAAKTVEFNVQKKESSYSPVEREGVTVTYGKPEHRAGEDEAAASEIARMVAESNPAYARSTNMAGTFTRVIEDAVEAEDVAKEAEIEITSEPIGDARDGYRPAAEYSAVITEYTTANEDKAPTADELFKPYTPPTVEDAPVSEGEDATLRVERTMITPLPDEPADIAVDEASDAEDTAEDVTADAESDGASVIFDFDEGDEEEDESDESGDIAEIFGADEDEGDEDEIKEIPPQEQNPDVIRMREQFPFLNPIVYNEAKSEPAAEKAEEEIIYTEEVAEEVVAENAEDEIAEDEPPFDVVDEDIRDLVEIVEEKPKKKKPSYEGYEFPPLDLLAREDGAQSSEDINEEIQSNADKLIETLASFGVTASIKGVDRGPRITRYEVVPAKGVKVSSILGLSDDIALNLAAESIRMEAPIPGKSAVGVEIPNSKSSTVRLRELLETEDFVNAKSKTTVCMGKDVAGQPIIADVSKMPHALIAGATGMGKSVCMNSLIISMLYKARPDEVKFIMIDPKQVEFTMYNGIPHLLVPIVNDVKQAAGTLMWAVEEMERRYEVLKEQCVRNIDNYNEKVSEHPEIGEKMHRIVIVIDEFAELIMQVKNPVESLVIRIAQKARAAGIHLIIGTQKPVKEVITGLIKSNIPSKMSCKVLSNRDSILIFDQAGAEKLLDRGDMLVAFANSPKPQRVQCAFVSDGEVEAIMEYLKKFSDGSNYDESVMEDIKRAADKCSRKSGGDYDDDDGDRDESGGEGYLNDKQFLDAVEVAVNTGKISTSLIQRKISIGYGKAAKFIDVMEDMGIVSEPNGQKPRDVLMTKDQWHEKLARTMYE